MINKIKYIMLSILLFTLSCQLSNDLMDGMNEYNTDALLSMTASLGAGAFYNNDEMTIICTPSEAKFTVKYTIDGSDPSRTAGIQYNVPITINTANGFAAGTVQIRAVAYDENRISGIVSTTITLGDGTAANPYEIATPLQLKNVSDRAVDATANFRQIADIDLSSYSAIPGWVPIGDVTDFTGNYDGGNFTISNLTINRAANNQGLFGTVAGNAALRNINLSDVDIIGGGSTGALAGDVTGTSITISNCDITGTSEVSGVASVGGLIGYCANATITGCSVTVKVTGTADYTGGFAGYISSTDVIGCNADVEVIGKNYTGGLIGYADRTGTQTILRCTSAGEVRGENGVGGLVGITGRDAINKGVLIDDSLSAAAVFGTALVPSATPLVLLGVGGLVGALLYGGEITICRAFGNVTNAANTGEARETGGLVGAIVYSGSTVTDSYAEGNISAPNANRVGGFVGLNHNTATIGTGNHSTGNVTGYDNVGGFVGYTNSTILSGNYSTGDATGHTAVGGFSGWNAGAVTGCYHTTGTITGTGSSVGGFSGYILAGAIITECYAKGNVTVSNNGNYAGGFAGEIQAGSSISTSFARGIVTNLSAGFDDIGGFAGISLGDITDCYSTGAVQSNGTNYGGFIGSITAGNIIRSYSTGNVWGTGSTKGGFVGLHSAGTYAGCFWLQGGLINTLHTDAGSPTELGIEVTPYNQGLMKTQTTFTSASWTFPSPWNIIAGTTYPYLVSIESSDFPQ